MRNLTKKQVTLLTAILAVIIGTGIAVYFFTQQGTQTFATGAQASTGTNYPVTCKNNNSNPKINFKIISTSPTCQEISEAKSDGKAGPIAGKENVKQPTKTYQMVFGIENTDSVAHEVTYRRLAFFCPEPYGQVSNLIINGQPRASVICVGDPETVIETVTIQPGQTHTVTVTKTAYMSAACGSFQNDLELIAVDGNITCDLPSPHDRYGIGGGCYTGTSCPAENPPARTEKDYGTCAEMTASVAGSSITVNSANSPNELDRTPQPGDQVTLSAKPGNTNSEYNGFWIKPKNAAWEICNFYMVDFDATARVVGQDSIQFTMPDWKNTSVVRNDGFPECANTKLNFDEGLIFGANYFPKEGYGNAQWCAQAGPLPSTPGKLYKGGTAGAACTNICVIQTKPGAPQPTTAPQPSASIQPTAAPQPSVSSQPTTAPQQPTPTPAGCGLIDLTVKDCSCGTQCDPSLGDGACTEPGNTCIPAGNGTFYCAKTENETSCRANPSQPSCCGGPTSAPQGPTETPVPTFTPFPTNSPIPTYTPFPTFSPIPTYTPIPAQAPVEVVLTAPPQQTIVDTEVVEVIGEAPVQPTFTPIPPQPTFTPFPTYTPIPTYTPQPTLTPQPMPVAGNPVPWVVAGVPVLLLLLGFFL